MQTSDGLEAAKTHASKSGAPVDARAVLAKERPEAIQWKIEVPANRYDLLCPEGLARAFRIFLELQEPPHFAVHNVSEQHVVVRPEVRGGSSVPLAPLTGEGGCERRRTRCASSWSARCCAASTLARWGEGVRCVGAG